MVKSDMWLRSIYSNTLSSSNTCAPFSELPLNTNAMVFISHTFCYNEKSTQNKYQLHRYRSQHHNFLCFCHFSFNLHILFYHRIGRYQNLFYYQPLWFTTVGCLLGCASVPKVSARFANATTRTPVQRNRGLRREQPMVRCLVRRMRPVAV